VGTVRGLNVIKETVLLEVAEHDTYVEVPAREIKVVDDAPKSKPKK
jgi:hypothetical protein